jgi:formylglycine-generating enzyme required for sulfatase activity
LRRAAALLVVLGAVGVAVALARARRNDEVVHCGSRFMERGPRCVVPAAAAEAECPPPLEATGHGCDAPDVRVLIPASVVAMGPSDWEAEGRVRPRSIRVEAFRIDAFEATRGHMGAGGPDAARAANALTRAEAQAYCASRGGRLPTEDEWIVAAASAVNPPRRYPWGDTGAVCRRAAWGLATGPCALDGDGPDTVGSHPDGDSPLGLHDVAGNAAEWVQGEVGSPDVGPTLGVAKGGSWKDSLATELRIWARLELPPERRDPRVGVRCAYPP